MVATGAPGDICFCSEFKNIAAYVGLLETSCIYVTAYGQTLIFINSKKSPSGQHFPGIYGENLKNLAHLKLSGGGVGKLSGVDVSPCPLRGGR